MLFASNCQDENIILLIGRMELAKREGGCTEAEMYELEMILKDSATRKEWEEKKGFIEAELKELYENLKYRRRLFKSLRKESKENFKKIQQKEKISQEIKEKTNGQAFNRKLL